MIKVQQGKTKSNKAKRLLNLARNHQSNPYIIDCHTAQEVFMFHFTPTLYRSPFSLADALLEYPESTKMMRAATDIIDADDRYLLEIELPGYHKEDIEVSLQTKYLTIKATPKTHEEGEAERRYLRRERSFGEYCATFTVQNIEAEGITVSYENGVLTVALPKKKPIEPETRRFSVQ